MRLCKYIIKVELFLDVLMRKCYLLSLSHTGISITIMIKKSVSVFLFQDIDDVQVHYPGIIEVMTDLQGRNHSVSMTNCSLSTTSESKVWSLCCGYGY